KDPLMKLVSDIAGGAGDLGGRVRRGFGGFATGGGGTASSSPTDQPPTDRPDDESPNGSNGRA
ncbi:peptidase M48, partial [Streptomyces umbrinus]